jgi:hypothetical protein
MKLRTDREKLCESTREKLARRGIRIRVSLQRKKAQPRIYKPRPKKITTAKPVAPQDDWSCYCGAEGNGGSRAYWAHKCVGKRVGGVRARSVVDPAHRATAQLYRDLKADRERSAEREDRTPTRRW